MNTLIYHPQQSNKSFYSKTKHSLFILLIFSFFIDSATAGITKPSETRSYISIAWDFISRPFKKQKVLHSYDLSTECSACKSICLKRFYVELPGQEDTLYQIAAKNGKICFIRYRFEQNRAVVSSCDGTEYSSFVHVTQKTDWPETLPVTVATKIHQTTPNDSQLDWTQVKHQVLEPFDSTHTEQEPSPTCEPATALPTSPSNQMEEIEQQFINTSSEKIMELAYQPQTGFEDELTPEKVKEKFLTLTVLNIYESLNEKQRAMLLRKIEFACLLNGFDKQEPSALSHAQTLQQHRGDVNTSELDEKDLKKILENVERLFPAISKIANRIIATE